jgi:hypothetical protein
MGKDTTKNLVGQPIVKQMLEFIPRELFDKLVKRIGNRPLLQDI